jgi:hypothetical protein
MNRTLVGDVQYENGEIGLSQCVWCRHRADDGRRCRAFPKAIPNAILRNRHDHRYPYDGDSGVRYEPEAVEIEFVDVEPDDEFIPVSAEPPVGRTEASKPASEPGEAEIIAFGIPTIELEDIALG